MIKTNKHCCNKTYDNNDNSELKKGDKIQEIALLAKALAHPVRVKIIKELSKRKTCFCGEIVELVKDLAQSTVSQHLKVLKKTGIIIGEVEGTAVCYCVDKKRLKFFKSLLDKI